MWTQDADDVWHYNLISIIWAVKLPGHRIHFGSFPVTQHVSDSRAWIHTKTSGVLIAGEEADAQNRTTSHAHGSFSPHRFEVWQVMLYVAGFGFFCLKLSQKVHMLEKSPKTEEWDDSTMTQWAQTSGFLSLFFFFCSNQRNIMPWLRSKHNILVYEWHWKKLT